MVTVYKNDPECVVYDPETFFSLHVDSMNFYSEESALIINVSESAHVTEDGYLRTPYGRGTVDHLRISTKLMLCMLHFPCNVFHCRFMRTRELEKILAMPDGSILLWLDKPLPYLFNINARSADRVLFETSTDLNLWYFGGGHVQTM